MKIVKQIQDDDYQDQWSQISSGCREDNNWPKWFWGKDTNNRLYCKGWISGKSVSEWSLVSSWGLPMSEKTILQLAEFLKS